MKIIFFPEQKVAYNRFIMTTHELPPKDAPRMKGISTAWIKYMIQETV